MHDLARFLGEPLVLVGLCAIVGGGLLVFLAWAFTGEYERGGYESDHKRPKELKPWHVEPTGERAQIPSTQAPARHRLDTVREETTNLGAYVDTVKASARSRVVMIGPEGIEDGYHAGTSGRVRQSQEEDEQEEGSEDRERREDEGRPLEDGEEGGAYPEASRPVGVERWFRNTVTGEYIFVDRYGRRVDFDA